MSIYRKTLRESRKRSPEREREREKESVRLNHRKGKFPPPSIRNRDDDKSHHVVDALLSRPIFLLS